MSVKFIYTWNGNFKQTHFLFTKILGYPTIKKIKNHIPTQYDSDDLRWLIQYTNKIGKNDKEIKKYILNIFKNKFIYIRGYHACCPMIIDSYYKNGIKPFNQKEQENIFKKICKDAGIKSTEFESAINQLQNHDLNERKKVYFFLDKEIINYQNHNHYLLEGSEYLNSLLSIVDLKNKGRPTIFECKISIQLLSEQTLLNLMGIISMQWVRRLIINEINLEPKDFTLSIEKKLPACCIIKHFCPKT